MLLLRNYLVAKQLIRLLNLRVLLKIMLEEHHKDQVLITHGEEHIMVDITP